MRARAYEHGARVCLMIILLIDCSTVTGSGWVETCCFSCWDKSLLICRLCSLICRLCFSIFVVSCTKSTYSLSVHDMSVYVHVWHAYQRHLRSSPHLSIFYVRIACEEVWRMLSSSCLREQLADIVVRQRARFQLEHRGHLYYNTITDFLNTGNPTAHI